MRSDTPLDYAVFQLSPKCSRCELFVSGDGKTEKLASGLLKPFVTHLTFAKEQVAQAVQSIKLEVEKRKNGGTWFTKGTIERFVRFVSTPEVLELVVTFDAEMSQLEAARRIYLQGTGSQLSSALGGDETGAATSADMTKKELLRAIDVRLVAVRQDLTTACARASAAGFTIDTVTELQLFADRFGAHRLNEACTKFISVTQRRPDLIKLWKVSDDNRAIRSSSESDMSIDDPTEENAPVPSGPHQSQSHYHYQKNQLQGSQEHDASQHLEQLKPSLSQQTNSFITFPMQHSLRELSSDRDEGRESDGTVEKDREKATVSSHSSQPARRLSVQDRINLFENKQKEQSRSGGSKVVVGKSVELRRLSSDVSLAGQAMEKAVLRRWSGASDMSVDLSSERKETESSASTPCSTSNSQIPSGTFPSVSEEKDIGGLKDTVTSSKVEFMGLPGALEDSGLKDRSVSQTRAGGFSGREEALGSKDRTFSEMHSMDFSGKLEGVGWKDRTDSETQSRGSFGSSERVRLEDQPTPQHQLNTFSGRAEDVGWKDQVPSETQNTFKFSSGRAEALDVKVQAAPQSQFRSFPCQPEQVGLKDQAAYQTLFRVSSGGTAPAGIKEQESSQERSRAPLGQAEDVGSNDRTASHTHLKASVGRVGGIGSADEPFPGPSKVLPSRLETVRLRDQPPNQVPFRTSPSPAADVGSDSKDQLVSLLQSKAFKGKLEDDTGTEDQAVSQAQYRGFEGDLLVSQSRWSSSQEKIEEVGKKEALFSRMQVEGFSSREKDSGLQGMKLQRQSSAPEQSNKFPGGRSETNPTYGNGEPVFTLRKVIASSEIDSASSTPIEQVQKVRLSKGNQELNNELQMKANELEKLFAAHKLRVPGDQSGTAWRSKTAELQVEQVASAPHGKPVEVTTVQFPEKPSIRETFGSSSNVAEFDANSLLRVVDNQDYGNTLKLNIADLGFSDDSKGKFYDRYMQKRDAKLREEWSSTRVQKEAKMKAMQDSLERSRAELNATFSGSVDRQGSALYARRHAEKMRSFNIRSATKNREQPIESVQIGEDEDLSEILEQTRYGQEGSFSETFLADGSSRSIQSKRILPNKSLSSSTPRTSAATIPRLSVKPSNSSYGRRRTQPENPLVQSVPNFSDFRKENTKPSSGISKTTIRSQLRSSVRSKSTSEELSLVKEDKPRRSHSMRKSSAGPGETRDLSPLNSDGDILTTSKFDKEQPEQSLYNKIPKNGESKPFLRKGNGIGPGAGVGVAKLKASMAYENLKTEEESDELADQLEESVDMVIEAEEEEEEYEPVMIEDDLKAVDYPADSDDEKPGISKESEKSGDPESENGEVLKSICQVDPDSIDEVAAVVPSMFHTSIGPVQDSPGESPASWNSRGHQPFSYTQETSDIDAFVDSPMGSPASWNSHSLTQMEADAARMRKKWGSAQKPILVANVSQHQSRKDVTKGFKRLLKFGRKSRGTESLVDWISATTSEGDDDTEDGRDLANRSSEDLRKSRMGFSQDSYNDGELFNEQVQALGSSIPAAPANFKLREDHLSGSSLKAPRSSFFSLSSFRSKGSESKPR